MGKLAIGISLIMAIYALFLHITYLYFFGNGSSLHLSLNGFIKKFKGFLRSIEKGLPDGTRL
ncbi:hypothetical protein [Flagellimonas baculiformis]|uniref:hypothetical protein n=1 Tax=Flagellimonas baculiformis TaxID=3067310 RepID=UPI0026D4AD38|nr:hypothetical protein [Muricauda sp. D6]